MDLLTCWPVATLPSSSCPSTLSPSHGHLVLAAALLLQQEWGDTCLSYYRWCNGRPDIRNWKCSGQPIVGTGAPLSALFGCIGYWRGLGGIKSPPIQNWIEGDLIPSNIPQSTPNQTSPSFSRRSRGRMSSPAACICTLHRGRTEDIHLLSKHRVT
jgi:hypothetical protein